MSFDPTDREIIVQIILFIIIMFNLSSLRGDLKAN